LIQPQTAWPEFTPFAFSIAAAILEPSTRISELNGDTRPSEVTYGKRRPHPFALSVLVADLRHTEQCRRRERL